MPNQSNYYKAKQPLGLQHHGEKGMHWYKHVFGVWQNQAKYAANQKQTEKDRRAAGKVEKEKRNSSRAADKEDYTNEKGHKRKYYTKLASARRIGDVTDSDLKRMTNRLKTENNLKEQINVSRALSGYEDGHNFLKRMVMNVINGNASYDAQYKSIYRHKEEFSDKELNAITSRLTAENDFRAQVNYSKGKLTSTNYEKLNKQIGATALALTGLSGTAATVHQVKEKLGNIGPLETSEGRTNTMTTRKAKAKANKKYVKL